jgi:hypothetical protein
VEAVFWKGYRPARPFREGYKSRGIERPHFGSNRFKPETAIDDASTRRVGCFVATIFILPVLVAAAYVVIRLARR